jgi:hypothetical protein
MKIAVFVEIDKKTIAFPKKKVYTIGNMAHMAHMIFHIVSEHGHGASDRELTPNQEERVVDELKKSYSAPQLAVENFVLEAHIAAGCGKVVSQDYVWEDPEYPYFLDSNNSCNLKNPDDSVFGGIFCYHTAAEGTKIFTS